MTPWRRHLYVVRRRAAALRPVEFDVAIPPLPSRRPSAPEGSLAARFGDLARSAGHTLDQSALLRLHRLSEESGGGPGAVVRHVLSARQSLRRGESRLAAYEGALERMGLLGLLLAMEVHES